MNTSQTGQLGEISLVGKEGPDYEHLCESIGTDPGGVGELFKVWQDGCGGRLIGRIV